MSKKFTDLTLKATAAAADIVPINDVSASTDKKTTVGGMAAAVAASLPDNSVKANSLDTAAITIGYAQTTSVFATSSSTFVDVTGITTTVTVPTGGRRVEFIIQASAITSTAQGIWCVALVEDGTVIQQWYRNQDVATAYNIPLHASFSKVPSAGSHTYKVQASTNAGTVTISAGTTSSTPITPGPASILVKVI